MRFGKHSYMRMIASCLVIGTAPLCGLSLQAAAQTSSDHISRVDEANALHHSWSELISDYRAVGPGDIALFDYAALKASEADLARLSNYIHALSALPISSFPDDAAFAAWANLYNALTVQVVVQNYPVDSIRDIRSGLFSAGPWKRDLVTVEGKTLTLDNIEHDILRVRFSDPRVHYAVNCASLGCPDLQATAWTAETLDADLNQAARHYINHPRGVTVLPSGKLRVSKIYDWYEEDFGGTASGVVQHIKQYADPELAEQLSQNTVIANYVYDWSLNDLEAKNP